MQATRIGKHDGRCTHQPQHLKITLRRQHQHARRVNHRGQAKTLDIAARARVQRKHQWQVLCHLAEHAEQPAQRIGIIHIGRPVQRDHTVTLRMSQQLRVYAMGTQRIGHRARVGAVAEQ